MKITIGVPATTANLGPGFDCLALALDLWNEAEIEPAADFRVEVTGEGSAVLPADENNLVIRAYLRCLESRGMTRPGGLHIRMTNNIPIGSGLGSSASAVVMGILAANTLHELRMEIGEMIRLAAAIEGHSDNASAALLGGLVVSLQTTNGWLAQRFDVPTIQTLVVLPAVNIPTRTARQALPRTTPHKDAVFNIGRAILVVEALRRCDLDLLAKVMEDRIHEPYRLKLIPGAEEAITTARKFGAAASLSGAGPGVIAFCTGDHKSVSAAMQSEFYKAGIQSKEFFLPSTNQGALIR